MPLLSFLGLVHLAVTGMLLVLGRVGFRDKAGIQQRALGDQQARLQQHGVDFHQHYLGQVIGLKQPTKFRQRGGTENASAAQINSHEVAQCLRAHTASSTFHRPDSTTTVRSMRTERWRYRRFNPHLTNDS